MANSKLNNPAPENTFRVSLVISVKSLVHSRDSTNASAAKIKQNLVLNHLAFR